MNYALNFLALVCLFALVPDPAAAGPIAAAVAAINAFAASSAFAAFIVRIGVSLALTALTSAIQGKPKGPRAPGIRTDTTTSGGNNPQTFVLGRSATAGNMAAPPYSHPNEGDVPNEWLTYVVDVSDLPGCRLSRVMVSGEFIDLEDAPAEDPHWQFRGMVEEEKHHLCLNWYDGTQTAADPWMLANYAEHPERPWADDMVGAGLTYAVLSFRYNRKLFNQLPAVRFEVLGIPLYDPRRDTSVGGAGPQRWDMPASWAFTENPIVMIYNILRGITLPDGSLWGGRVQPEDLPLSNWFAAMNECDLQVKGDADGTMVAKYRAGLEVKADDQPIEIIDSLRNAASAELVEFGGTYKVRVGPPALPVFFFTDEDVVVDRSQSLTPYPGLDGVHNAIHASYPDPDALWEVRDAPPRYNAVWEAEDGGRQLVAQVDLPAVHSAYQVQSLMKSWIADERRFRRHGLTLPPAAMVLEPLDACGWTSEREGYTAKVFEVGSLTDDLVSCLQTVALREREAGDFVWDPADAVQPLNPSPVVVVPSPRTVPGFDLRDHVVVDGQNEARRVALRLVWDASRLSADDVLEWQLQLADGAPVASGSETYLATGELIVRGGILANTSYRARARIRALQGGKWTGWAEATTGSTRFSADDLSDAVWEAVNADAQATASALLEEYTIDVIAPIAGSIEPIRRDLELRAVEQRTVAEAVAMIGDRVLWAVTQLADVDGRLADAGIVTDPETGTVRIYAVEQEAERISEAEIRLNAAEGLLSLSATQAWVNEQISQAVLDPSQIPLLDDLQLLVNDVRVDLDAAEAALSLAASQTEVDGLGVRLSTAEADLDAANAAIALKAEQSDYDNLAGRVQTAEVQITALDGPAITQTVADTRHLLTAGDTAAKQTLASLLQAHQDGERVRQDIAYATTDLRARIDEDREAEASRSVALGVSIDNAMALLEQESLVRASTDQALASDVTALDARLDGAEDDLAAQSFAQSELTARVTSAEGAITSQSQSLVSLTARIGDAEDDLADQATAVSSLTARMTSAEGVNTSQAQSLTSLTSRIGEAEDDLAGQASALGSLTTRVTSAEGVNTSQAQSLTSLTSRIGAAEDDASDQASALNSLSATVSGIDDEVFAQAQSIASLSTALGNNVSTVETISESVDGMLGRHMLRVNVNGVATGMVIAAEAGDTGAVQSSIAFSADAFTISAPNGNGAATPFAVYTSGRTLGGIYYPPGVYLEQAYIGRAAIGRGQITDVLQSDDYAQDSQGRPTAGVKVDFKNGQILTYGAVISRPLKIATGSFTAPGTYSHGAEWLFVNTGIRVGKLDVWSASEVALVAAAAITTGASNIGGLNGNNRFWSLETAIQPGARWNGYGGGNAEPDIQWARDPSTTFKPWWASGGDQRLFLKIRLDALGVEFENPKIEWSVFEVT